MQLALDLLVTEPDIDGFFRVFMKTLIEETDSLACGVFLLDDDATKCELWMAYVGTQLYAPNLPAWDELQLPRESMSSHLFDYRPGWTSTIEYTGDDPRLPQVVRDFNRIGGLQSIAVTPLMLPNRNLGWMALCTGDAPPEWAPWRRALTETIARQATLALHQSRLAEQSLVEARRQAVLEERNRIARDIHDTLAQGFAAILMQLQSTQRVATSLPRSVASSIDNAIDLARSHMIEARRSVCTLRPQSMESGDFSSVLERTVELARRTTDIPIDLSIEELPGPARASSASSPASRRRRSRMPSVTRVRGASSCAHPRRAASASASPSPTTDAASPKNVSARASD
jgi:signal transduction histidine kinase